MAKDARPYAKRVLILSNESTVCWLFNYILYECSYCMQPQDAQMMGQVARRSHGPASDNRRIKAAGRKFSV